jgi:hypothetical protein
MYVFSVFIIFKAAVIFKCIDRPPNISFINIMFECRFAEFDINVHISSILQSSYKSFPLFPQNFFIFFRFESFPKGEFLPALPILTVGCRPNPPRQRQAAKEYAQLSNNGDMEVTALKITPYHTMFIPWLLNKR